MVVEEGKEAGWGGRDEHLIGLPVTGQGKHKLSAVLAANAVSVCKTVLMPRCLLKVSSCLERNARVFVKILLFLNKSVKVLVMFVMLIQRRGG